MTFSWTSTKKWMKEKLWKVPKGHLEKRFKKKQPESTPPHSPGRDSPHSTQMTSTPTSAAGSRSPWGGFESPFTGPVNRDLVLDYQLDESLQEANICREWQRTY